MAAAWMTRSIACSRQSRARRSASQTSPTATARRPGSVRKSTSAVSGGGDVPSDTTVSPAPSKCSRRLSPTKPEPPVTRTATGSALRPLVLEAQDAARGRARVAQCPAARVDRMEEVEERAVEGVRILEVDGVAGLGQDDEPRARDRALHEEARLEAGLVLVAGDDERRHGEPLHVADELPERRPPHLHAAHGVGRALGRMLGELGCELVPAARVLVLVLDAGRADRVFRRGADHAGVDEGGGLLAFAAEALAPVGLGAIAAAGDDERTRERRVPEAEMERREAAHREPRDMRL